MAKRVHKRLSDDRNSLYLPTYIDGIPVYGLGSWLKSNAGIVGTVAGAGLGALVGMPHVGASIGGGIGGSIQGNEVAKQDILAQQDQINKSIAMNRLTDPMNNPTQAYMMACGGKMKAGGGMLDSYKTGGNIFIKPEKKGTFKTQATKMGMGVQEAASTILLAPEDRYSPTMRKKANFAANFAKADGGRLDDFTFYAEGGTHESNPLGGINIGNKGLHWLFGN